METGTTSHLDRMGLTNRLCEMIEPFLKEHGFEYIEYGQPFFLHGNSSLTARFKKLDIKKSAVALLLKFSPDYLIYHRATNTLFLMDAKSSITPIIFEARVTKLRYESKKHDLDRHRIGEIEREAWDNYNNRFPRESVAICFAAPYNPNLILVEWATKLTELFRFELDINKEAGGSRTPHVNIDLDEMRTFSTFFAEEFDLTVDEDFCTAMKDMVKGWPLNKPAGRVNWIQFNYTIARLSHKCPWLKGRCPRGHKDAERLQQYFADREIEFELF